MGVRIQPIQPEQVAGVKPLLLSIAQRLFAWPGSLDEIIARFEQQGYLVDLDDPAAYYAARDGLFLTATDGEQMIGTGAIRKRDDNTAELRRLWLLEAYRGQGIGYRLVQALIAHAEARGYRRVRLQTGADQTRALSFYEQIGFTRTLCEGADPDDVCMEMTIGV